MMNETVKGFPARRAALRMMDSVIRRGEPLDQSAHASTKGLSPSDRAFAIAITQESFRWIIDLDALIDSKTKQILPEDAKARCVLRIALAQMLCLGTPHHAAIATALPLLTGGPKRLVHGVLGSLSRGNAKLPDHPTLPMEVQERWFAPWGQEMLDQAAIQLAKPPALDLTVKDFSETDEWVQKLGGESLTTGHIRLPRGQAIESLDGFDEGAWWVQDLAASIPARILGEGNGRTILDLCAAPGGKTMQLAASGWYVTALDKSDKRMERLKDNLERVNLSAETLVENALNWETDRKFDAILIDTPCSATGTFRRHPEVLNRIGDFQISQLCDLQSEILRKTVDWITPGGSIIYATCSLEHSEGEAQIESFLNDHPEFSCKKVLESNMPKSIQPTAEGYIRTLPGMLEEQGGLDGFFAAHLIAPK